MEFNVCKETSAELKCMSLFIQHLAKLLIEKLCLIYTRCVQIIKQYKTLLLLVPVYSLFKEFKSNIFQRFIWVLCLVCENYQVEKRAKYLEKYYRLQVSACS